MTKKEMRDKNIEMALEKGYKFLFEGQNTFQDLTKIKLAELSNLSVRSINRYFKTWDEMIQAVYLLGYEIYLKNGLEKLKKLDYSNCKTGLDKLIISLQNFKKSNLDDPNSSWFLTDMELYLVSIKYEETFLRQLDEMYLKYKRNDIKTFFEQGQKDGSVKKNITFEEIMDYYFFFTCSITYNRMQLPRGSSFKGESAKYYLKALELREKLMIDILRA